MHILIELIVSIRRICISKHTDCINFDAFIFQTLCRLDRSTSNGLVITTIAVRFTVRKHDDNSGTVCIVALAVFQNVSCLFHAIVGRCAAGCL